jgi:predicted Zn-dependent protease with MMP-like domain
MEITLLVNRFNYQEDIDELRDSWLEDILMYLELNPVELKEMLPHVFVDLLYSMNLDIVDYPSLGAMAVVYEGDLIGEWAGPELTLKKDKETGELYYEVLIQQWSILDEEIDMS